MRQTLVAVLVALALSVASSEAAAQCSNCSTPIVGANNINAYNAGLYDYYCYAYRDGNCDTAKAYAAAAGVPVFAPTGAQCNDAGMYNWYCRYYEYYNGYDIYGYCAYANSLAAANSCCACPAAPSGKAPEVQRLYFMRDYYTGDSGVSTCDQGRSGRYTGPLYWAELYRRVNDYETGTGGWGGYALYQCVRWDAYGRSDEYLSTDPNCYGNGYYGSRVDWSTTAGYTLSAQYEGGNNVPLYLCTVTAGDQYGGQWTELRVDPYYCAGGTFLGYARSNAPAYQQADVSLKSAYDQCVEGSGCFGECGPNCDGLLGTHYSTSACLTHDRCVCQNGGNMWSMNCLGDALAAGVSWVAAIAVSIIKSIVSAVVNVVKAIVSFLCFWC